jgi:hypothetical protein
MGCWNGTCGLSGLPITHGTEMYVFPIVESYRDSFCYSTALYRPSVLPFRAEYNDYGAGENCSGIGLDLLIAGIRDRLVEMDVGENQYHDIAVKSEGFDVDQFFEACHKRRLEFKNPMRSYKGYSDTLAVFFTMVRKDIADRLWAEWKFDIWKPVGIKETPTGFESDQYYIKGVTYARLAETVEEYMQQRQTELAENTKDLTQDSKDFFVSHLFFQQPYEEQDHILCGTMSRIFGDVSEGGFAGFFDLKNKVLEEYLKGNTKYACDLIRECLLGHMVNSFMESTRKVWLPPMHQGSQSECLDEYRLMNRLVDDAIAERNRMFEEHED